MTAKIGLGCGEATCREKHYARGWCQKHYMKKFMAIGKAPPSARGYEAVRRTGKTKPTMESQILNRMKEVEHKTPTLRPGRRVHTAAMKFMKMSEIPLACIYREGPWDNTVRGVVIVSVGRTAPENAIARAIEKLQAHLDSGDLHPLDLPKAGGQ